VWRSTPARTLATPHTTLSSDAPMFALVARRDVQVSVSIDSDDYFGTMMSGSWAHLKRRPATAGGKAEPVIKFTAKAEVDRLEKLLRSYIYAKVPTDQNTKRQVQKAFGDFDIDGSGCVSLTEFIKALERFGMHVAGQRPGIGGLGMDVVTSLFDKYDKDSSGAIDYKEFTAALFKSDEPSPLPPAPAGPQKGKAGIKKNLCEETACACSSARCPPVSQQYRLTRALSHS
jgi:hypothetical protein